MTEEDLKIVRQIENAIKGSLPTPASLVRGWMECTSLEVRAVLTDLILDHSNCIEPTLSMEEVCDLTEGYYRDCLIQNVAESQYVPNRHIAGYELVRWFAKLWNDPEVPRRFLERIKAMIRDLYLKNTVPPKEIVTAVLEHLFETPDIQAFFADWKSNPKLAEAFTLAKGWGDQHTNNS